jgi:Mor family transcriptional regulator
MSSKSDRNRRIFAAFDAGKKLEQLAEAHCLTQARIRAILTAEQHRRFVSPEPFYRALRATTLQLS